MLEMEGRVVGDQSPTIDTPRIPRANPYSECPASNERWGDKGGLSLIWQRSTPPLHPPSLPFSNSFYAYGPPSGENNPFASNPFLQRRKRKGREKVCVPRSSCANVCGCSEEERERSVIVSVVVVEVEQGSGKGEAGDNEWEDWRGRWKKKGKKYVWFGRGRVVWASNSGHRARMTSNRSRALCQHSLRARTPQ